MGEGKHTPGPVGDEYSDWIECWSCAGEGETESCFEDTCVCVDPPCLWTRCDVCQGKGGWPRPEEEDFTRATAPMQEGE